MTINNIGNLLDKCTGCMACVDICPQKCIELIVEKDGFIYSKLNEQSCIECGQCYKVCPIINKKVMKEKQELYAAYSGEKAERERGSSGGIYEVLAKYFLEKNFYICGAAFDNLELKHIITNNKDELVKILKSKYIQSNMVGIYNKIYEVLKKGQKVFYCGTPCQVSALKNFIPDKLKQNLVTADIICHGVPSQSLFDKYIKFLEKKYNTKIYEYNFRVKNNRYKHPHGYSIILDKNGKKVIKNGIYTQSSFYNAFKKYLIFRNSCYNCQYATLERVSDITLADFWGISRYNFKGTLDKGISMVIINTNIGNKILEEIKDKIISKKYPIEYGIESNYCLTHSTKKPKYRDEIIKLLERENYEEVAKKYFDSSLKYKIYWALPAVIRNKIRRIREKNV